MAKDVNELKVYQESLRLIAALYEFLNRLPGTERDLEMQIKRAAKSIPANIAEGFAKKSSYKEVRRYLLIALASSDEVISHLRIISTFAPELAKDSNILLEEFKIISRRINKLYKVWHFEASL